MGLDFDANVVTCQSKQLPWQKARAKKWRWTTTRRRKGIFCFLVVDVHHCWTVAERLWNP